MWINCYRSSLRPHFRSSFSFYFGRHCQRWKSTKVSVSEEKQLFTSRRIAKEIERRIRTLHMETMILDDIGELNTSKKNETENERLSSVSIIASRYLAANASKFSIDLSTIKSKDILKENREINDRLSARVKANKDLQLPLGKFSRVEFLENSETNIDSTIRSKKTILESPFDRGFHVEGDIYKDEYVAGVITDLPAEMELKDEALSNLSELVSSNSTTNSNSKANSAYFRRYGPEDAVEEIDFVLPTQKDEFPKKPLPGWKLHPPPLFAIPAEPPSSSEKSLKMKRKDALDTGFGEETGNENWKKFYGHANPAVKPANEQHRCGGCGATFHCQDSSLPGFLPATIFVEKTESDDFSDTICRRCYLLKEHQFLVNVSVSPIDYERVLGHLRTIEQALVLLLVDMTDFPACIYSRLPEFFGHGKPTIIVGNKVDLLPPDAKISYLDHFERCLRQTIADIGLRDKMNILGVKLISAKTGYGIEGLVSLIFKHWGNRGDVYLIGCTNTGKSTLFNALLQSDICKIRAVDLLQRATTSVWPGTTLNLLKFPIMNPSAFRLVERNRRLYQMRKLVDAEEGHRRVLLEQTGDSKYVVLQGIVDRTPYFESPDPETKDETEKEDSKIVKRKWNPKDDDFAHGRWCFDTPGTVTRDQIINYLTLEELIKTVPKSILRPRTYVLRKRETLFIGGLVRIDNIDGPHGSLLTIFASGALPIFVEDTSLADDMYNKYVGTAAMAVPYGDKKRLDAFPRLKRRIVKLIGLGPKESCADVTFSSAGWASVTTATDQQLTLGVWTPNGAGIFIRTPALLPFIVNNRGRRIAGTNAYEDEHIKFPETKVKKDSSHGTVVEDMI